MASLFASIHLASAVENLRFADASLGLSLKVLGGADPPALHGLESFDVSGMREACKLLRETLSPAADAVRFAPCQNGIAKYIQERPENPANVPGLERAAVAIGFAVACIDEAIDALGNGALCSKCVAAAYVLEAIQTALECAVVRQPPSQDLFGNSN
jgi:hypothetical protein